MLKLHTNACTSKFTLKQLSCVQWSNRRGGGTFFNRKFLLINQEKKRGKEERENGDEKKEDLKREEVENWKCKGTTTKTSRGLLFFFFLSLFETTEICLGSTKVDNFYREKAWYFTPGKNQEKLLYSSYTTGCATHSLLYFQNGGSAWIEFIWQPEYKINRTKYISGITHSSSTVYDRMGCIQQCTLYVIVYLWNVKYTFSGYHIAGITVSTK